MGASQAMLQIWSIILYLIFSLFIFILDLSVLTHQSVCACVCTSARACTHVNECVHLLGLDVR